MSIITPAPLLTPTPDATAQALALVREDMAVLDRLIDRRLDSGVPLVREITQYIISAGGKRLRPALLLLLCGALGEQSERRFALAAIVEFIHTATLLHDDVVDESAMRRGRATANEIFGNAASVLVGDFLYSRAFQMMAEVGQMRVMEILAEATNVIAEGEVLQLMHVRDPDLSEADYLHVIRSKTAKLFEASARLAAVLAGQSQSVEQTCVTYGQALGTAFQVIDDVLDYDGDAQTLGKNLGDDLREGKVTLPLIVAMQRGDLEQRALIRSAIEDGHSPHMERILDIVRATGALQATRQAAAVEAQRACDALKDWPRNVYTEALLGLSRNLLLRQN